MLALSFELEAEVRIQSLYGCGNAIGKAADFKERTHREPQGEGTLTRLRLLIVGEDVGVFFSQYPVAQTPSIAAKNRVYVVVDLELNHQLQNGVAWTGSIISPLFSLPTPIEHFHS